MKRLWTAPALILLLAAALPAAAAGNPDVDALDRAVAGKPVLERKVDLKIHVVGYDLKRHPRAKRQLEAVATAGGGGFSTAGIKDIKKVMRGVVSGSKPRPVKRGRRLEYGESIIRHGRLER